MRTLALSMVMAEKWVRRALTASIVAAGLLATVGALVPVFPTMVAQLFATAGAGSGALRVQSPTAVFSPGVGIVEMTIVNGGGRADRLLGAETSAASRALIQESVTTNRVTQVVGDLGGVVIPPHGVVDLRVDGTYIMLLDPFGPRAPGHQFMLTLLFEKEGALAVPVSVEDM